MSDGRLPEAEPILVGILDDHELLLDSLGTWVAVNAPDFDVVLRARSWIELVQSPSFPPQLVLMDYQLADSVSIEARIRTCRAAGVRVIVVSGLDTREARDRALAAGAAAFVSKALPVHELIGEARRVMDVAGPHEISVSHRHDDRSAAELPRPRLSLSEEQALRLYVQGHSTVEVGRTMNVSFETAKTYLRRVREKYSRVGRPASRKAELIRRAAEDGYLE